MRIIIKPLGYVLVFWLAVAALAYPVLTRWVKRRPPLYRPDMNCVRADNWMFFSKHGGIGSWRISGDGSLRIAIEKAGRDHFDIGVSNPLGVELRKNDRLRLLVRGRCSQPSKVTLVLHRQPSGEESFWKESLSIGPTWTEKRMEFPTAACDAGDGFLSLYVGSRPGTYEFSAVTLVKRGTVAKDVASERG